MIISVSHEWHFLSSFRKQNGRLERDSSKTKITIKILRRISEKPLNLVMLYVVVWITNEWWLEAFLVVVLIVWVIRVGSWVWVASVDGLFVFAWVVFAIVVVGVGVGVGVSAVAILVVVIWVGWVWVSSIAIWVYCKQDNANYVGSQSYRNISLKIVGKNINREFSSNFYRRSTAYLLLYNGSYTSRGIKFRVFPILLPRGN